MYKTAIYEQLLNTPSRDKWIDIGIQKKSGVLVPLFSVYSRQSVGIGDLYDLKILLDWAKSTNNTIVQLLPMNETGTLNCPYDAISSFALEPSYISLRNIPHSSSRAIELEIKNLQINFPCGATYLDYSIKKEKLRILWAMYLAWDHRDSMEFKGFKEANFYWLEDFALYKELKKHHNDAAWWQWRDCFKNRNKDALNKFYSEHNQDINFHMWVQWQLHRQFKEAKQYANSKKIFLKGDLPILVSGDSSDVWAHPDFFKLEFAAGAPPDMYCAKGQRWGMPTYNWDRIAFEEYSYLKEKLKYAENFYDILRVDHVVGLFRIWSIPSSQPQENKGLNGFFDPQDESSWAGHGKAILSAMLNSTKMLLCAEDLGVIPKVCTDTLAEFGIPGNDVERWTKDWNMRHDFLKADEYRLFSVAMLSTHDTTNLAAWWENEAGTIDEELCIRKCNERGVDYSRIKQELFDVNLSKYGRLRWKQSIDSIDKLTWILGNKKEELLDFIDLYQNSYREKEKLWDIMGLKGAMREDSDPAIIEAALKIVLNSKAIFCINTIIDFLLLGGIIKDNPYSFRINTPGTVNKNNWAIVMPISLEALMKHRLTKHISRLNKESARA